MRPDRRGIHGDGLAEMMERPIWMRKEENSDMIRYHNAHTINPAGSAGFIVFVFVFVFIYEQKERNLMPLVETLG